MKNITQISFIIFLACLYATKGPISFENAGLDKQAKTSICYYTPVAEDTSSMCYLDDDSFDEFEQQCFSNNIRYFISKSIKGKYSKFDCWGIPEVNPLTLDIPPPSMIA